ncbi:MAG: GNAT family N-acetyltransferase [Melioribacteraceae bacterium]|nr:MAG: GNAT family N-acetyltransferase [Melioribacteraceae bacterium]
MQFRKAYKSDFENIFPMLKEVFDKGDTYVFPENLSRKEIYEIWMIKNQHVYVAVDEGKILGTYYLKPNQPGRGSHVCNAGYIVSSEARGKGLGKAMCRHSIEEAKKLGYGAMQFNIVVSTNKGAIKVWKKCGFKIVATLQKVFNHKEFGLVDAFVMFREL